MSRIDRFKLAPIPEVEIQVRVKSTPAASLVGGVRMLPRGGHEPTLFTYADGRTCAHPDGEFHECAYVSARNRLIYTAEQNVKRVMIAEKQDPNGGKFDAPFMAEMDRLWKERAK